MFIVGFWSPVRQGLPCMQPAAEVQPHPTDGERQVCRRLLLMAAAFGFIGFLDDYVKVSKSRIWALRPAKS